MESRMSLKHWSVLLLTAALFGSSFFFIKLTVASIPPLTLAAGRATLAAIAMMAVLRLSGQPLPTLDAAWRPILILGVLTAAIPYAAIAWGQIHIDSSLGGILFATIPVFSVLVAPWFLVEERLTAGRAFGAALGFLGVILAIGPDSLLNLEAQVLGSIATVAAALSYASGTIYARLQDQLSPLVMTAGQLVVASLLLVPISLLADSPWTLTPTTPALLSLAVVALINTALPVLLLFWLVRNVGATNTSLLAFFMPVAAVLLGVVVLDEPLLWFAVTGLGLIIVGAAIVTDNLSFISRKKLHAEH